MATAIINSGSGTLTGGVATVAVPDVDATDQILVTVSQALCGRGPAVACALAVHSPATVTNSSFEVRSLQDNAGSVNIYDNSDFSWAIIRTTAE